MSSIRTAQTYQGVSGAPGLALGPAFLWEKTSLIIPTYTNQDPLIERGRLDKAISLACEQIQTLVEKMKSEGHPEEADVFGAHLQLAQDKSLYKRVDKALASGVNVESAWFETIENYVKQLEAMDDETFRLRAIDLRDVSDRVLRILLEVPVELVKLTAPSVILARDLTPSETVGMNKEMVLAFCTADGGPTSHTAILAKALQVPAVVGLGDEILEISVGALLMVDALKGQITVAPDDDAIKSYHAQNALNSSLRQTELATAALPAITRDGKRMEIVANIGGVSDAVSALKQGAEGVGLFRTEFLFLERTSIPSEEEQYTTYKQVLDTMGQRPVVIRTLDAGGDKELAYLNLPPEANPFLGDRAIRLCLSQPVMFKEQLRALLRAGVGHDMRIMFPMIATLRELRLAKAYLEEAKAEITALGFALPEKLQVGIMIEIPAAAVMADRFAKEVDFFSIGTNDLTQYTLAADRTNPKVAHLNDHCHPAVLRLIEQTTRAAHEAGIWVGVCGEMGGDPDALPLLVGMGIDELSMSPSLIPHAKSLIRKMRLEKTIALSRVALEQDSAEEVRLEARKINWE
jgi:phosphoenolpyruvate-protein phosphotransferase